MEQCARIYFFDQCSYLRSRFHRTDLIVGVHDRHEDRIGPNALLQVLHPHPSGTIHRKICHTESLLFQIFHCFEHRRMLYSGSDQMRAVSSVCHRHSDQRQIIRLRPAGSKNNLLFIYLQQSGNLLFCLLYILFGLYALKVHTGRIPVIFQHDFCHKFRHFGKDAGRRRIIQIYFHFRSFSYSLSVFIRSSVILRMRFLEYIRFSILYHILCRSEKKVRPFSSFIYI